MKYIEQKFTITFTPHSLRIRYQPSEDTMMIDISAIQSLEIMQNQRKPKSRDCLFGLLNHTVTPMGSRTLRSNILQPPTRHDSFIYPRYEALEELTANEEMFREIRKGILEGLSSQSVMRSPWLALKLFQDVEKLLTKASFPLMAKSPETNCSSLSRSPPELGFPKLKNKSAKSSLSNAS